MIKKNSNVFLVDPKLIRLEKIDKGNQTITLNLSFSDFFLLSSLFNENNDNMLSDLKKDIMVIKEKIRKDNKG